MNSWGENGEGLRGWGGLAEWLAGMMVLGLSSRLVCLTKVTGESADYHHSRAYQRLSSRD
jgi:hypothetical protein